MTVTVNGTVREVAEGTTLRTLIEEAGLGSTPCAAEINRNLVPRREHESRRLAAGDVIELVSLVGGIAIFSLSGGLDGAGEQAFEGVAALAAAAVVTSMLLWMRRQSAALGGELRRGIDAAHPAGGHESREEAGDEDQTGEDDSRGAHVRTP
mgnify:CR=1 FL=1